MTFPVRSFRDLKTWQVAQELCLEVYKTTDNFPRHEMFGLVSQMRRAGVSIPSNIAEGFGRQTAKEKQQFYHHSLGSLYELDTQIDLAKRLVYISESQATVLEFQIENCRRLLLALIQANKTKILNHISLISNPK